MGWRSAATRGLLAFLAVVVLAAAGAGLWFSRELRKSLPTLDGELIVAGLGAPVRIERDGVGVPRIVGVNREDVARATGFLHAQDRFFQMDLLRRRAAGELAEILGAAAVEADRDNRLHRFRSVAERVIERGTLEERALLEAYAGGVNAGLRALGAPPFEYFMLGVKPAPWKSEDSVLAGLAMFITLQDPRGRRESDRGVLADVLPKELFAFLTPPGTEWDAPLVGGPLPSVPAPGPEVFDLRQRPAPPRTVSSEDEGFALGSNGWAVAGTHTRHGGAILANDMHLHLEVPNIWYRVSLEWGEHRVTGVTLPGTPAVVVGSNRHVAWGFTNTEGDWSDLVVLETDPKNREVYRTPDGPRRFEHTSETIRVKGQADETLEVVSTIWGPVVDKDHRGRSRALRWVAHEPEAVNLRLSALETTRTVEQAVDLANRIGAPAQNFICADENGRIAWTVLGVIPRRLGFGGALPGSWADGNRRWDGWLLPTEYPRILDPPSARIWTANARVVDGALLQRIGESLYDLGARARQIRNALLEIEKASEREMLQVQLDDRADFLARWRELILRTLTPEVVASSALRRDARALVENWGGHASTESAGYRLVRTFRLRLHDDVLGALTADAKAADPRFSLRHIPRTEGPLWALVAERPAHLLNRRFQNWDEQLLSSLDAVLDELTRGGGPLADQTWGAHNTARIRHPISNALPALGLWLDMAREPLPGDAHMPRFQAPAAGASQRLVISPGRESEGYFHMPGGQSGHPLSPFYRAGHSAWTSGEPAPFLPGPAIHTLTLQSSP